MTFTQFKEKILTPANAVYQVFQDFFGESYTDMQNLPSDAVLLNYAVTYCGAGAWETSPDADCSVPSDAVNAMRTLLPPAAIYVWWPVVTVTNEFDKSEQIQDLYALIGIDYWGHIHTSGGGFLLNRATYTMRQWIADYMHSHVARIPKHNLTQFQQPCLGRGPIRQTIQSLAHSSDRLLWMQFCNELNLYVSVESLHGVPYHKLEDINNGGRYYADNDYTLPHISYLDLFTGFLGPDALRRFMDFYLRNGHFRFSFHDGAFSPGMSYYDYMIDVSNAFISYFNKELRHCVTDAEVLFSSGKVLRRVYASNGRFYDDRSDATGLRPQEAAESKILDFKGREIRLSITDSSAHVDRRVTLLTHGLAMIILDNILRTVNYYYKNEHRENSADTDSAQPCKRCAYF